MLHLIWCLCQGGPVCLHLILASVVPLDTGHGGWGVGGGLLSASSLFFIFIFLSFYPIFLGLSAVLSHPDFLCFTHYFRG